MGFHLKKRYMTVTTNAILMSRSCNRHEGHHRTDILCYAMVTIVSMNLIIFTSGCLNPEDNDVDFADVIIGLSSPMPEYRNSSGVLYWDVSVEVNRVLPKRADILWKDLEVTVTDMNGSILISPTRPEADDGIYGGSPEVWYGDFYDDARSVDTADEFRISSMDLGFQSGKITIRAEGYDLGSILLPHTFPQP